VRIAARAIRISSRHAGCPVLTKKAHTDSERGDRQKLAVVAALTSDAESLVIDELTAGSRLPFLGRSAILCCTSLTARFAAAAVALVVVAAAVRCQSSTG
jgi:hypothetical protein